MASRPSRTPETSDRIIVVAYLRTCSGLGEAARLCYAALRASGAAVVGIDLSAPMMQDQDGTDFDFKDGSNLTGAGTLILHVNAPWVPLALWLWDGVLFAARLLALGIARSPAHVDGRLQVRP